MIDLRFGNNWLPLLLIYRILLFALREKLPKEKAAWRNEHAKGVCDVSFDIYECVKKVINHFIYFSLFSCDIVSLNCNGTREFFADEMNHLGMKNWREIWTNSFNIIDFSVSVRQTRRGTIVTYRENKKLKYVHCVSQVAKEIAASKYKAIVVIQRGWEMLEIPSKFVDKYNFPYPLQSSILTTRTIQIVRWAHTELWAVSM